MYPNHINLCGVAGCCPGSCPAAPPATLGTGISMLRTGVVAVAKFILRFYKHIAHVCIVYRPVSGAAAAFLADSAAVVGAELIIVAADTFALIVGNSSFSVLVKITSAAAGAPTAGVAAPSAASIAALVTKALV